MFTASTYFSSLAVRSSEHKLDLHYKIFYISKIPLKPILFLQSWRFCKDLQLPKFSIVFIILSLKFRLTRFVKVSKPYIF